MSHRPPIGATHSGDPPSALVSLHECYQLLPHHTVGSFLVVVHFWIPPNAVSGVGSFSAPVITVIGSPTTTVDAQSISRSAVWPESKDYPSFQLEPGQFPAPATEEWLILAGTVATGTRIVPQTGHRAWTDYRDNMSGHVWSLAGSDACAIGCASWESGATAPRSWSTVVNDSAVILAALPPNAPRLEEQHKLDSAEQLCVLPHLLPLPQHHGLPMGQVFSVDLGADGFADAIDIMMPNLAADLGYVSHPWFRQWLDLV
jgi:hypothetical protein